jgi:hypothetical protein
MVINDTSNFNDTVNDNGVDDDWNLIMKASIVFAEIMENILLTLGIAGMFNGIEISHPVYSVLFQNLCFNFIVTSFNLVALIWIPFQKWARLTLVSNYVGMLFHNTRFDFSH